MKPVHGLCCMRKGWVQSAYGNAASAAGAREDETDLVKRATRAEVSLLAAPAPARRQLTAPWMRVPGVCFCVTVSAAGGESTWTNSWRVVKLVDAWVSTLVGMAVGAQVYSK